MNRCMDFAILARQALRLSLLAGMLTMVMSPARAGGMEQRAMSSYDGVVESEHQTALAPQVSGAVLAIAVQPGASVKAGQVLVRLDAQVAAQAAMASVAQAAAVQAQLALAQRDIERQRQLFAQGYISQAALDRAQARYQSSAAETRAQLAQASSVQAQAGYYLLRAPYDGVVADIPANVGDMAQPGHPLLTLYDPAHLRVTVLLPQTVATHHLDRVRIQIPDSGGATWLTPSYVEPLPTADPMSHTVKVYLGLKGGALPRPGTFAKVWLEGGEDMSALMVPLSAVVQRAEMSGVYVLDQQGHPQLRQVRLGRTVGSEVEILSGVGRDDRVAPDAQAALAATH